MRGSPDVVLFTEVCSSGFGRYAGTYRIASELRDNGYIVQVVEYFTKWSTYELMSIIRKFVTKDCLWVGVSTTFLSPDTHRKRKDVLEAPTSVTGRDDWEEISRYIKHCNPNCVIAAGGAKANMIPQSNKTFDVLMVGQGENSAITLSNALFEKKSVPRVLDLPYSDYPN